MILLISIEHIDPNGNISEEIIEEYLQDFEVGKNSFGGRGGELGGVP